MAKNHSLSCESVSYFFSRSKDVHKENDSLSITLFGRLSREFTYTDEINTYKRVESVWVDIEEIKMEQASEKLKSLPNQICRYEITEEVFRDLYNVSRNFPSELYSVTPMHFEKQIEIPPNFSETHSQ